MTAAGSTDAEAFIGRWSSAGASERANAQPFLMELADLLGVPRPANTHAEGYSFEFPVKIPLGDGTFADGRIDLYHRGCFVLEAKQFAAPQDEAPALLKAGEQAGVYMPQKKAGPLRGSGAWDDAMLKARGQAERYARSLPAGEPTPPFLLVVDVGHSIEVFADFTQAGKAYLPFPDPRGFRIRLAALGDARVRDRLRRIWIEPLSLDPAKISAAVTREIAGHLAVLASSLEDAGHPPKLVAEFLTRCLFCMFAEDIGLLPENGFRGLLESLREQPEGFVPKLRTLFAEMQAGSEFSVILNRKLLRFNGGLFEDASVLPLDAIQLGILAKALGMQWKDVEPAIFGTLLERALDPGERHQLGAHYTPRAYVERLVLPTIVEPLRTEWDNTRAAALVHAAAGRLADARKEILGFHSRLCETTVLDPACGSGNFLYVTLEHLKRLEGEVLDAASGFGENLLLDLSTHAVDPHQFLGIEINPRAAAITELVLWIGYLQWHFRTRGQTLPSEPVLKKFRNIECRDAVLAWDGDPVPVKDDHGGPVTVWDRQSYKTDPVTGREIPDESRRVPLLRYPNARPATWPKADFIVGNPPFLGTARMREDLGDRYAETLRAAYPDVPESTDFVMYWWHKAAGLVSDGAVRRFGLITTNSLRQTFNRRVVQPFLDENSLVFAIPDHPWVDTAEGAAVRIAMTVVERGIRSGELWTVAAESPQADGSAKVAFTLQAGRIAADLTIGANIAGTVPLLGNEGLSSPGVKLHGSGFIVTPEAAKELGLGQVAGLERHIRAYRNGKDLADAPRGVMLVDLFGLEIDDVRQRFPAVYQHVLTHVKADRDGLAHTKDGASYARLWWIFGKPRPELRRALNGLTRYIATGETGKHRHFQFLDIEVLPDNMIIAIASSDAFHLGVLSSRIHVVFALAAGGRLGVGNDPRYNKTRCFDPFPFPDCDEGPKARIRALGEELDAHRKRVQGANPGLSLTAMYNVLEALREGRALTAKEKAAHDAGLVSVLRQLHDDLDAAVAEAYGWPADLPDAEILSRLVALNAERAAEEARGKIRYLRPEYQNPTGAKAEAQSDLTLPAATKTKAAAQPGKGKAPWPKSLAGRVQAVEAALRDAGGPVIPAALAKRFSRAKADDVAEILETLVTLGRASKSGGRFSG